MDSPVLCIVGLGYVGLPLAHAFSNVGYNVVGFDVNAKRIAQLQNAEDCTNELTSAQLEAVDIEFSNDALVIAKGDIVILAIPTPVDENNNPDLTILKSATATVGANMKKGAIVVFESTVYPGTTEEICGPILENESGMTCGVDFTLGYSPERVNPGDKEHTIDKIVKVVAGQDQQTKDTLCKLYGSMVTAGIHPAENIKVAEMAKAIENAQRDLNIAFVNEIAMLSNKIGISSKDVLEAAKTKWNFLPFQPGLVGGHCIGVDPYYLVEKAAQLGMETQVITAGRSVNDGMGKYVASQISDALQTDQSNILVLGVTFKEDIPDTRNSKVIDVVKNLESLGHTVEAHDPFYDVQELATFGYKAGSLEKTYDAVVYLVPHKEYKDMSIDQLVALTNEGGVIYDLKTLLNKKEIESKGYQYLSL